MKKTLMSLAALMMLMAAPVMTSCSNELDEAVSAEQKGNVVTLTIAAPEAEAESRVGVDPSTLKITGWEVNDKVNLYIFNASSKTVSDGVEFTCTDASAGTFTGTLPAGKTLADYNLAVYGATASKIGKYVTLTPTTYSSDKLKDVVMMIAQKDNDAYKMKIVNNVLKVTNTGSTVEVAWTGDDAYSSYSGFFKPLLIFESGYKKWIGYYLDELPSSCQGWANVPHITLTGSNAVTYLNMTPAYYSPDWEKYEYWGLAKEDGSEVLEKKNMTGKGFNSDDKTVAMGKLWTVTVNGN